MAMYNERSGRRLWPSTVVVPGGGFVYLVAIIDWISRCALAWQLSNTLDGLTCRVALQQALGEAMPAILNTDQGAQFTTVEFTETLLWYRSTAVRH